MTYLFIIASLVICALVVVMFFILKNTVKTINNQTKLYFVDKLQEYDHLINEKEEKLDKINKELKEKEDKGKDTSTSITSNSYEFDYNIIDNLNRTKYQDKNIFELNKKIDEKFNIDYVSLLKKFISTIDKDREYDLCLNLKNKFTTDNIYLIKTLSDEEKDNELKKILSEEEYKIYEIFLNTNKNTNIEKFIDYINELIDLNNQNITVYVGNKEENYDYLSENIKTVYTKEIYKGIKILYRGKIYDYSLNERNV